MQTVTPSVCFEPASFRAVPYDGETGAGHLPDNLRKGSYRDMHALQVEQVAGAKEPRRAVPGARHARRGEIRDGEWSEDDGLVAQCASKEVPSVLRMGENDGGAVQTGSGQRVHRDR